MKLININKIILLLLLASITNGCFEDRSIPPPPIKSSKEELVLDLSGRWKFSLGDDLKWKEKDFKDDNWEKIYVPSSWENQGFHGYNGYAWYRTSFKLKVDVSKKDIYLVLGYVDDVDQTFINGNLIGVSGGFPNSYRTAYNAFRKYYIPKEFLNKDGVNIIAVRIYDDELDGGIMSGKIGLYTYEGGFEPDVNLCGIWDFKTGDDSSFLKNNTIDSNTDKLMVPAHWDVQGYQDYDGFAWYKKTFILPKDFAGESLILLMGKIDDIDQTFINGILVGSTGLWNFNNTPTEFNKNDEYRITRIYSVPQKLLKFGGENTIVVRVYDGFQDGGIYEGPVGLIKQSNYKKYFSKK
ncbi:MAG: beta galactosidase jelly roll domain-containing protein [Ignavibacteria bacterium]|nr:beta galactosidase jelly roll domain-containing protein [Ignavibacteria bacterium]